MKKRTFSIDCSSNDKLCQELHNLLTLFINTAFPPLGSECSQATRESLLELNARIANNKENCEVNTRQRPLLKTAISWYFEEIKKSEFKKDKSKQQQLLQLISKKKRV